MTQSIPDTENEDDDLEAPVFEVIPADDDPRKDVLGMYQDLVEQFDDGPIRQMVEEELSEQAAQVIEFLYTNQDNLQQEE